jgi:glutaminyl-peptide cyclotransferase
MKKLIVTNIICVCTIAVTMVFSACQNETRKPQTTPAVAQAYRQVSPGFNADSAYYFVKTQVEFGPRVTNSEAHQKCGDWMVQE